MAKSLGFIKQSNSQIIEVLESDSEVLGRIQTEFHTMLRGRTKRGDQPIEITCFFEELALPGIGIVSILLSHRLFAIVRMLICAMLGCSRALCYPFCLPIDRNPQQSQRYGQI